MPKEIIVNHTEHETRIAVLDNSNLTSLFIERAGERSIAGNIYSGKVVRVLPGMQAAFVNIGLDRTAFLYVADAAYDLSDFEFLVDEDEGEPDYEEKWRRNEYPGSIEDIIKDGQEVFVQVSKEPFGNKGARITTHISLAGRNLVLTPTLNHIGISRKIKDEKERARLQKIIEKLSPEGYGFIARTASEGKEETDFQSDFEYLRRLWETIKKKKSQVSVPGLVHKELDLTLRTMRDLYTEDVDKIVVDSKTEHKKISEFMVEFMPAANHHILEVYEGNDPIFDSYGIELDIERALNKKIWLKSGSYITIEETEALCAIDVNTGKYTGKRTLEETILKTNLEAVKEIAYQLQVRNIGGIIIIDFIDMENEANREKVFNALEEELEKDRNKTNIQKISELGLIEMTRQRTGKSLGKILSETCPYCDGRGGVKSKNTICYEIFRELERAHVTNLAEAVCIIVHKDIANILLEEERSSIEKFETKLNKKINIKVDNDFYWEHFEIRFI
jgi:ribonuclease G